MSASGRNDESAPNPENPGAAASRRGTAALIGLCWLALLLRAMFAARSGVWADEGQFLQVLRLPTTGAMIEFLRFHESHPPLFYLLMRAWQAVFGPAEMMARIPPILIGVVLVPTTYWMGSRMFGRRAGMIAAVLTAASTTLVMFSATVRPYSLTPLLCLASCYALWRGLAVGGVKPWGAYVGVTLALLFSHNWGWLVLAGQWVASGAWFLAHGRRMPGAAIRQWVLSQLAVAVGYAPWLPVLLFQTRHAGHGSAPGVTFGYTLDFFLETTTSLPKWGAVAVLTALVGAAFLRRLRGTGAAATALTEDRRRALFIVIGVPLGALPLAFVISTRTNVVLHHCIVTLAPCVVLAMSYGIARLSPPRRRLLPVLATAGLAALYLVEAFVLSRQIRSNVRELAATIAQQAHPDDLIVIAPGWFAPVFNYYYRGANPQIQFPAEDDRGPTRFDDSWLRMADPSTMARIRQRLLRAHAERRRIWLVMEHRMINDGVLGSDTLVEGSRRMPIMKLGLLRANQLRRLLIDSYGPADTSTVPPDQRGGGESLDAMLFAPGRDHQEPGSR